MNEEEKSKDQRVYQIRFSGQMDEEFVAAFCPAQTLLTDEGDTTLLANIRTDQSGIIGLIRTLHNLGCTILAVTT
ncbi:MAG: hypothetical protein KBG20_00475 [Caldilineaceae bacterium]|nr:hypothetical protein [Caldilineaceae bacterium]MBP8108112.1 hypothetical protein [Caldilineaceae bacterium]MBP8123086.1 hypothetical protein [Caldilineaceae bacterium]MBP9070733.1 hypothetical protein [Caldilineaceae bacterium]